jgi:hypothetical protein
VCGYPVGLPLGPQPPRAYPGPRQQSLRELGLYNDFCTFGSAFAFSVAGSMVAQGMQMTGPNETPKLFDVGAYQTRKRALSPLKNTMLNKNSARFFAAFS